MRTLTAQRLKKQAEYDSKNRGIIIDRIFEEAEAEAKKLEALLAVPAEKRDEEIPQRAFEKYTEDDEDSYLSRASLSVKSQIKQIGYHRHEAASRKRATTGLQRFPHRFRLISICRSYPQFFKVR